MLCSATSLLLCLMAAVAWVDSYRAVDWLRIAKYRGGSGLWGSRSAQVHSCGGGLSIQYLSTMATDPRTVMEYSDLWLPGWKREAHRDAGTPQTLIYPRFGDRKSTVYRRLGFDAMLFDPPAPFNRLDRHWSVVVIFPHMAAVVVLLPLPAMRVWMLRRERRRKNKRLCSVCGYDLRASPERCPECGTHAPSSTRSTAANGAYRDNGRQIVA
jgi:hypothetical protein